MKQVLLNKSHVQKLIHEGQEQPLATKNYPSRGQTAVQKLYQTEAGKLFFKQVSERNHRDCQIDVQSGTLAEREYWAFLLAKEIGLHVPELILLDEMTTVQCWLPYPYAHQYATYEGPLIYRARNIFHCALFDWLTGQVDRHNANYLYDFTEQQIILIDSAHAFLKQDGGLPAYLEFFESIHPNELSKVQRTSVFSSIKKLTQKHIRSFVKLRDESEAQALLTRHRQLMSVKSLADVIALYRGGGA